MKTAPALAFLSLALSCASTAYADTFGIEDNTFDIEFVTIGNPGNADDTTGNPNPAGAVAYRYRIAKFEISEFMFDKANTLGSLGITKHTFGIDKPATLVTWFEAAKFVNWLNTNTGNTPAYKFDGGGNFQLWQSGDAGYNPKNLYRNRLARYFLPSMDEWYKAAYYDPIKKVYYNYPTGSDIKPDGIDMVDDPTFDAVFDDGQFNPEPNDIDEVGVLSPYGTAGQGGNVQEWEETDFDLVNDSSLPLRRGARGGQWADTSVGLLSSDRFSTDPSFESVALGFRVASIPEPSTFLLFGLGSLMMLSLRRRLEA